MASHDITGESTERVEILNISIWRHSSIQVPEEGDVLPESIVCSLVLSQLLLEDEVQLGNPFLPRKLDSVDDALRL